MFINEAENFPCLPSLMLRSERGKGIRGTAAEAYLNSPAGNKLTFHAIDGGQQDNC